MGRSKGQENYWKAWRIVSRTKRAMQAKGYEVVPVSRSKLGKDHEGSAKPAPIHLVCLSPKDSVLIHAAPNKMPPRKVLDRLRQIPRPRTTRVEVWVWKDAGITPETVKRVA